MSRIARALVLAGSLLLATVPAMAQDQSKSVESGAFDRSVERTEAWSTTRSRQCSKEGTVPIKIGRHELVVPRRILASVTLPNGQYDFRWRCHDISLEAQALVIRINRGMGDEFYKSWVEVRKLPTFIEIVARGQIKNFTSQFLNWAIERGEVPARNASGFDVVLQKKTTLYDASPHGLFGRDGHKIVFMCFGNITQRTGRSCRTSYPYDDAIDVAYRFIDGLIPEADWIKLDTRFREFLKSLLKDN